MGNTIRTWGLLAVLALLLALAGHFIAGPDGLLLALIFALVISISAYQYSSRLVLLMTSAQQLPFEEAPDTHRLAARIALRANLPKPRLYMIDKDTPNAFATGNSPWQATIVLTRGLLDALSRDEVGAVLAYELARIRSRDTLPSTIIAALTGIVTWFVPPGDLTTSACATTGEPDKSYAGKLANWLSTCLMTAPALIAAVLTRAFVSRTRDYSSDADGAHILGDPLPLARALEKLEIANRTLPLQVSPGLAHQFTVPPATGDRLPALFRTRPPTPDRVSRLRAMALQPVLPQGWEIEKQVNH